MEATIVKREQIVLVGFTFFGDPFAASEGWTEENEIGRLWQRFMAYMAQHGGCVKHIENPAVYYEVHIMHEDTDVKGHIEVFVGMQVARLEDVPVQLAVKMLPATDYAVFTLVGEQIISDWPRMIYQEWMPESGYETAHSFMFQFYDQRFKGLDQIDASVLDVYVPVKRLPEA